MRYGAALGYEAGYNIDTGADRYNTLVGAYSGYQITTGKGNVILGYGSGYDSTYSPTTGSYNILIGYQSWTPATTTSNFLNIGGLIFGTNLATTTNTISSGNIGIGTTTPAYTLQVWGSAGFGSATSTTVNFTGYISSDFIPSTLLFGNEFRITESTSTLQSLIFKNQKGEKIMELDENGNLSITGELEIKEQSLSEIVKQNLFRR